METKNLMTVKKPASTRGLDKFYLATDPDTAQKYHINTAVYVSLSEFQQMLPTRHKKILTAICGDREMKIYKITLTNIQQPSRLANTHDIPECAAYAKICFIGVRSNACAMFVKRYTGALTLIQRSEIINMYVYSNT